MEPPDQYNAELGALVHALISADNAAKVAATLRPDDFLDDAHKAIFIALTDLAASGRPIDCIDLALAAPDEYDPEVWRLYSLAQEGKAPLLDQFAKHLLDARRTRTIKSANLALADALDDPRADHPAALAAINAASATADEDRAGAAGCAEAIATAHAEYLATDEGGPNALPTKFKDLDEALNGGFRPGCMYILASRPGVGKSALALPLTRQLGSLAHPLAYVSREMSAADCAARLLTAASGVQRPFKRGFLTERSKADLAAAAECIRHFPVTFMDAAEATMGAICSRLARLARRPRLLVIDYLQLLPCPGHEVRAVEVGAISRSLKQLALREDLPVLALSQLNRGMEQQNREPRLSALRESGSIEQDADAVLLMHRPGTTDTDEPVEQVQVALRKNRNGPHAEITLLFDKPFGRFSEEGKVGAVVDTEDQLY